MASQRRPRIPDTEWEKHRDTIKHLSRDLKKKLEGEDGVISIMIRDHGFSASKSQYETKFKKWRLGKYASKDQWATLAHTLEERRSQGKDSEVSLHGVRLSKDKIAKECKRYRGKQAEVGISRVNGFSGSFCIRTPPLKPGSLAIYQPPPLSQPMMPAHSTICPALLESSSLSLSGSSGPLVARFSETQQITPQNIEFNSLCSFFPPLQVPDGQIPAFANNASFIYPDLSQNGYHLPVPSDMAHQDSGLSYYSPSLPDFGVQRTRINEKVLLDCLNTEAMPILRNNLPNLDGFIHSMPLLLQNLSGPNINTLLSSQEPDIKFVYKLVSAFANNLVDLGRLADDEDPQYELLRKILQQFDNLAPKRFLQILESFPKAFSQGLERGLFCAALEVGARNIVETVLSKSPDYVRVPIVINNFHHTPLQRSCVNGHLEVTRTLLDRGANLNENSQVDLIDSCFPWNAPERSLPARIKMFDILLNAGLDVKEKLGFLFRRRLPQLFHVYAHHIIISEANYNDLVSQEFLSTVMDTDEFDIANATLDLVLNKNWDMPRQENENFLEHLRSALSCAIKHNNMEASQMLLDAGVRPNTRCLNFAIQAKNIQLISHLLDAGVPAIEHDYSPGPPGSPRPPVAEAIRVDSAEVFALFRKRNLYQTLEGNQSVITECIIAACETGNEGMLDHLIHLWETKANSIRPSRYRSVQFSDISRAYWFSIRKGHRNLIPKLLNAGIVPMIGDVSEALREGHLETARLLLGQTPDALLNYEVFVLAIHRGSFETIQDCLTTGIALDCVMNIKARLEAWTGPPRTASLYSPLTAAILVQNHAVIDLLLASGAPVDGGGGIIQEGLGDALEETLTPLSAAVRQKSFCLIQKLLAWEANPVDDTAILEGSSTGDLFITKFILSEIAKKPWARRTKFGARALIDAVERGDLDMLSLLLNYADPNHLVRHTQDDNQRLEMPPFDHQQRITPFGAAIQSDSIKSLEMIQMFLHHNADLHSLVESQNRVTGLIQRTALLQAIETTRLVKVKRLVDAGASINMPPKLGVRRTPLQAAVELEALDIIQFLLAQGADVNGPSAQREGGTCLQLAAGTGNLDIASLLIKKGAIVNAAPAHLLGRTALESAAEHGRIQMISLLADHGLDLIGGSGAKQYERAIMFARRNGHPAVVGFLEILRAEAGADMGLNSMPLLDSGFQL